MTAKIRPVLTVESIEDVLPFWCDWLGCEVKYGVWSESHLSLAVLARDDSSLVLRTRASSPVALESLDSATYVPVDSIGELEDCLQGGLSLRPAMKTSRSWAARRVSHFANAIYAS